MKGKKGKILALMLFGFILCIGVPNVQAFEPIQFDEKGTFLKIDFQGQLFGVWRDTGSGPDNKSDTTDIFLRRNRLTFWGHGREKYGFIVQIEYIGDRSTTPLYVAEEPGEDFYVIDAYLMADLSNSFRLYAGKHKIQLTRENLESCFFPLSIDRSLFIYTPFQHSRDIGVTLWGNIPDAKVQYRLSVSEGKEGGNSPRSSFMYTGRVHFSLFDPEQAFGYMGNYLGTKKVLTVGAGVQFEPDAVYSDTIAKTGGKDYSAWTVDAFLEYPTPSGTITASAAYLQTDFDDAYKGSNPDPESLGIDGDKNGWYFKAGYLLPQKIGPGELQPFVRYEEWRFAQLNDTLDQKVKWLGAGINYLIDWHNLRLTLEYSHTNYEKEDPSSEDFNTLSAMIQYRF